MDIKKKITVGILFAVIGLGSADLADPSFLMNPIFQICNAIHILLITLLLCYGCTARFFSGATAYLLVLILAFHSCVPTRDPLAVIVLYAAPFAGGAVAGIVVSIGYGIHLLRQEHHARSTRRKGFDVITPRTRSGSGR